MSVKRQDIRVSDIRYRFKTPPFEFMFQWVLGTQTNGGSEVGESFYAASLVKEDDPPSWVAAWTQVARQVEQRAAAASNGLMNASAVRL